MTTNSIAPWMVVTPQQLKWGWIEQVGGSARHRDFEVLRRFEDGTYAVRNPELVLAEDEMRVAGAMTCPRCGQSDVWRRPSGDCVCLACGATWREVVSKPEVPKP